MNTVDVAIIGAGSAGLNARRAALAQGARVALFDPGPLGTTCARVGCMPSKLLIAAAERAHEITHSDAFGVHGTAQIDGRAVMERVRRMRDLFVGKTVRGIHAGGTPIPHRARFVGPATLEAGDERYACGAIVVATGSLPTVPPPYRDLHEVLLNNESVFELETLPSSVLVVGAGAIGLELGQALFRLGVRVTVLDLSGTLAGLTDPVLADKLLDLLDVEVHTRHKLLGVERVQQGARVRFEDAEGVEHDATWERVLVAAGRVANLGGLQLAAAGLDPLPAVDPRTGQVGSSAVYLAGDVTAERMLLHEAADEGRIAGENAARHPEPIQHRRTTKLGVVFSDPQVAVVGGRSDRIASLDLDAQSRAKVLMKGGRFEIYASSDGLITGATLIGPQAEHLAHLLAWSIEMGMTVSRALEMPVYHPVLEEGLRSVLRDLQAQLARRTP